MTFIDRDKDGKFAPKQGSESDVALPPSAKPLKRGQSAQMAYGNSNNAGVNDWLRNSRVTGVLTYHGKYRTLPQDKWQYDATIVANGKVMTTPFYSDEPAPPSIADVMYALAEDAENADGITAPETDYERSIVESRDKLTQFLGSEYAAVVEGERLDD